MFSFVQFKLPINLQAFEIKNYTAWTVSVENTGYYYIKIPTKKKQSESLDLPCHVIISSIFCLYTPIHMTYTHVLEIGIWRFIIDYISTVR